MEKVFLKSDGFSVLRGMDVVNMLKINKVFIWHADCYTGSIGTQSNVSCIVLAKNE